METNPSFGLVGFFSPEIRCCDRIRSNCFQQLPGGEKALVIFKLKLNNSIKFFFGKLKIKSPPTLLRMSPTFNKPINFRVNLSLFERENYFIVHPQK